MDNLLVDSLVVSGLGMLLLFFALAILYGLMFLMTTLLRDPAPALERPAQEKPEAPGGEEATHRAAVIAVALARADLELSPAGSQAIGETAGAEAISSWWAFHHNRQMARRPIRRRNQ